MIEPGNVKSKRERGCRMTFFVSCAKRLNFLPRKLSCERALKAFDHGTPREKVMASQ